MRLSVFEFMCCIALCLGQTSEPSIPSNLHVGLTERIGNFSLELLYHTAKMQEPKENLIMSPFTAWTVMAVISEGASANTLYQLKSALRLPNNSSITRENFKNITEWLQVNTTTVELVKFNGIFMDQNSSLEADFRKQAKDFYQTQIITLDFKDGAKTAEQINGGISKITRGRIPTLVESNDFGQTQMILTSALYFKGQWAAPFNASFTTKMPFFDTNNTQIGEVNMMYRRHNFPFASIKEIQARVIEIPYGVENRLSMLIMQPNPGVRLEDMFKYFEKVPLDIVFKELQISREEFGDDEVDLLLPRFKIESSLVLTDVFKSFGIEDLFDQKSARLENMARVPMYVSKVIHKAEIEVTEEGTTASGVTSAEFANRIGVVRFEANRPFSFMIIEKVTNSIVFGGIYKTPSLY